MNRIETFNEKGETKLIFYNIMGSCGISGNEEAESLAKTGGSIPFIEPESFSEYIRGILKEEKQRKWVKQ